MLQSKRYFDGAEIKKAYLGSDLLFDRSVPSYIGIGDIVNFDYAYSAEQAITGAFASGVDPCVDYRCSDGSTGSLTLVDGKADEAGWDLATGKEDQFVPTYDNWSLSSVTLSGDEFTDSSNTIGGYAFFTPVTVTPLKTARAIFRIKKKTTTTSYPALNLKTGGANLYINFDEVTGAIGTHSQYNSSVTLDGEYWVIDLVRTYTVDVTTVGVYFYPAASLTFSTGLASVDVTTMGTMTLQSLELITYENGLLYATSLTAQVGASDLGQVLTTKQPLLLREGGTLYDGVDDEIIVSIPDVNFTELTMFAALSGLDSSRNNPTIGIGSASAYFMLYFNQIDQVVIYANISGVQRSAIVYNLSGIVDISDYFTISASWKAGVGTVIYINGQPVTVVDTTNIGSSITTTSATIEVGTGQGSSGHGGGFMYGHGFIDSIKTSTEHLAMHTQWEANKNG